MDWSTVAIIVCFLLGVLMGSALDVKDWGMATVWGLASLCVILLLFIAAQ